MKYRSIEEHLDAEYGFDQYQAYDHALKNRKEIENSKVCGCYFCQSTYPPSKIRKWTDENQTACCPECGLANVVIGDASGMPVENKEFLSLVGAHWT